MEGKLEGRDVFKKLSLFPFPDSPLFFSSERFLKVSPSFPLPFGFSMMKTGRGEGGGQGDSEEPVPRPQCPVPSTTALFLTGSSLIWVFSVLI